MTRRITHWLIFVLVLTTFEKGYAQSDSYVPKVIPPSPDAAALGKYGEIPVGKYTGSASITVPIYTIKTGGIEIPISLSYQGGGIKVEELPGWTGLGWSLNAGGVIAISTVGIPDFTPNYGFLKHGYDFLTFASLSESNKKAMWALIDNRTLDTDLDNYFYNINGQSGKFLIDKTTMKAVSIPKNNLRIKLPDSTNNRWEITDAQGNKYIFGIEETLTAEEASHQHSSSSSYYLTKIITAKNEEINFHYQDYTNIYYTRNSGVKEYHGAQSSSDCQTYMTLQNYTENYTLNEIQGQRLSYISWKSGKIMFIKSGAIREDIPDDYYLDEIRLLTADSVLIKKFDLSYGYFGSSGSYSSTFTDLLPGGRLQLQSVREINTVGDTLKPYTFTYFDELPYFFSRGQDLWGYYNGADGNPNLLPITSATKGDAYRIANDYSRAGSIQTVTYPTGGVTEFFYESNEALIPVSKYYDTEIPVYGLTVTPGTINAYVGYGEHYDTLTVPESLVGTDVLQPFTFVINYPTQINCASNDRACIGNLAVLLMALDSSHVIDLIAMGPFVDGQASGTVYLHKGKTYELSKEGSSPANNVTVGVNGFDNPLNFTIEGIKYLNVKVGGARISKLINTTGTGDSLIKKHYYSSDITVADNSKNLVPSSGRLSSYPIFKTESINSIAGTLTVYNCPKITYFSNSAAPLAVNGGSTVGYKFHQETAVGNNENIKTLTEFVSTEEFPDLYDYSFPFVNENSLDYIRGDVLSEKSYAYKEQQCKLVKQEINGYQYIDSSVINVFNLKSGCEEFDFGAGGGSNYCLNTLFKIYTKTTRWLYKNLLEIRTYNSNGTDSLSTVSKYFYDNAANLQMTSVKSLDGRGDTIITTYKYPHDFVSTTVYDTMIVRNNISPVIEQISLKQTGNLELEKIKTNYQLWESNTLAEPSTIQKSIKGNTLTTELTFEGLDNHGNIRQTTGRDGVIHSYIWDYGAAYPIAEVIKADTNSIATTSFEADGKGGWGFSGSTNSTYSLAGNKSYLLSGGNITRSGLTNVTYIVSYWGRSGSVSVNSAGPTRTGKTIGDWTYYEHEVTTTSITVSGSNYIDELRLYPKNALMTTYTYTPLVGMTSQCDANNKITYYELIVLVGSN